MNTSGQYLGRFAPSPTGELHFGSLVAAMASYCDAKHHNGRWFVRIDDIDPPRSASGATSSIIKTLKAFGFAFDDVVLQSERTKHYQSALKALSANHKLYCCSCSRSELKGHPHYPRRCLPTDLQTTQSTVINRLSDSQSTTSIRMYIDCATRFTDQLHGSVERDFANEADDPVLSRKDGLFAYALACAVDDADGITHVVRGSDLLDATAHQIAVMQALGLIPPQYAHIPLVTGANGQKLSKQNLAEALNPDNAPQLLRQAWGFLGQEGFAFSSVGEFWNSAIPQWQLSKASKH